MNRATRAHRIDIKCGFGPTQLPIPLHKQAKERAWRLVRLWYDFESHQARQTQITEVNQKPVEWLTVWQTILNSLKPLSGIVYGQQLKSCS